MHDPQQPRRTGHVVLHNVKRKAPVDHLRQRLLLGGSIGISMLIILSLYAASFKYQRDLTDNGNGDLPRWGTLKNSIGEELDKQSAALDKLKSSLRNVANAQVTEAQGMAILKAKIESGSTTPQKN